MADLTSPYTGAKFVFHTVEHSGEWTDPGPHAFSDDKGISDVKALLEKREAVRRKAQYEKEQEALVPAASKIVPLGNGHLECRNTDCGRGIYWCKHIEQFVKDGRDASDIWDVLAKNDDNDPVLQGLKLQVPYVPTMGQWALVEFGASHFGNYKMYLLTDAEGKVDMKTGEVPSEFLGFASPGDGRRVLRDMVHTWFLPRIDEKKTCQSTAHSFQAQLDWERQVGLGDSTQKEYLAQCWSVFIKGLCLRCASTDALASDDDLVPDVSAPRRGWTR